jgi:hypothetical protein
MASMTKKRPLSDENVLPSHVEQRQLSNLDVLMKSNLLTLQTNELLNQVNADKKIGKQRFQEWFKQLKDLLMNRTTKVSLHEREISQQWLSKQSELTALTMPSIDQEDISITYICPDEVVSIGSAVSGSIVAPFYVLDLALPMDPSIYNQKYALLQLSFLSIVIYVNYM